MLLYTKVEMEIADRSPIGAAGGLVWRTAPRGSEIAIVHRSRYNDWTLPKGKLNAGESWLDAAVREVQEETGYEAEVIGFAGAIAYETTKGLKIVRFWNMKIRDDRQAKLDSSEVEEVVWLPAEDAVRRMTYPLEKAMVEAWARELTSSGGVIHT